MAAIDMWASLAERQPAELERFDAVYIGGGNTFRLLAQLRATGFDHALAAYARRGGAIYGGSAGAIILGRDILTCAHIDPNEVGLSDSRGLDLAGGHAIWCHYTPADDPLIYDYVTQHNIPVLAISERAGISIEQGQMIALGEGARRFSVDGGEEVFTSGRTFA